MADGTRGYPLNEAPFFPLQCPGCTGVIHKSDVEAEGFLDPDQPGIRYWHRSCFDQAKRRLSRSTFTPGSEM